MEKNEKTFCCLCSKYTAEQVKLVTVGFVEEVNLPITIPICKECNLIIHNLKRIYEDVRRIAIKNRSVLVGKEEVTDVKDSQG